MNDTLSLALQWDGTAACVFAAPLVVIEIRVPHLAFGTNDGGLGAA